MTKTAVFANGCFWCTEAVFKMLKGVISVTSGYTGGTVRDPTYEQVCGGMTEHAECLKLEFDPSVISYVDLLIVFFNTHNPTALNRQGNDVGTQYRSAIFYKDEEQKSKAENMIKELDTVKTYDRPIVTEVKTLGEFYSAGAYHQEYYERHKDEPYCEIVIMPKVEKIQRQFEKLLRA